MNMGSFSPYIGLMGATAKIVPPDRGDGKAVVLKLFEDLSEKEIRKIFSHEWVGSYHRGQSIFYEGTPPTGLYFVLQGKVKVYKTGLWRRQQIVRLAGPGDLLTLRAVGGTPRLVVSASALEDSEVLFLDLKDFLEVLKTNAKFAYKIIQILSLEIDHAEQRIRDLAQMNVRQRLADIILYLSNTFGDKDHKTIGVRLMREEIANIIGTSIETVVRLLSDFRDKGLIEPEGREIRILNRPKLEQTAHPDTPID